jgi:predicted O-methyltransferase YrrM
MTPEQVAQIVGDTGYMSPDRGRTMTSFIGEHGLRRALELGFAHGVSTCYIASAVEASGEGSVVSIDLESARLLQPSAEELLERCGLRGLVTLHHEPTSYTWRLMKMLEQDPSPRFDLCYVDGAHSWFVDGFAFFLVDRLLVAGGWFIFDDLEWTYATSPSLGESSSVRTMPREERETAQVAKVYELLVKTHPSYGDFRVQDGWAYARKIKPGAEPSEVRSEIVYVQSVADRAWTALRQWIRRPGRG